MRVLPGAAPPGRAWQARIGGVSAGAAEAARSPVTAGASPRAVTAWIGLRQSTRRSAAGRPRPEEGFHMLRYAIFGGLGGLAGLGLGYANYQPGST